MSAYHYRRQGVTKFWSPAQEEIARVFFHSPLSDDEFYFKVGHSREAYKSRRCYVKRCQQIRELRRVTRKKKVAEKSTCISADKIEKHDYSRPSPEMLADAHYRCSLRTPIMDILGDPPPGYSALDKRVMYGI
jgi:hypothetical protein